MKNKPKWQKCSGYFKGSTAIGFKGNCEEEFRVTRLRNTVK
jgi:hypothetical protein